LQQRKAAIQQFPCVAHRDFVAGKPNQNAFVERINRIFRDDVLNANLFNSVEPDPELAP
jgi:hypothetical protein